MTFADLHNPLTAFLRRLEALSNTELHDAVVGEILETGGTYIDPPKAACASHLYEISLYGIVGRGASDQEAISDWVQSARRSSKTPKAKPRNHAEEIAAVRASYQDHHA